MKNMDYGKGYKYSHDHEGAVDHQEFLPEEVKGTAFYRPKDKGSERKIRKFMQDQWGGKYE
jgi:putative ATPase